MQDKRRVRFLLILGSKIKYTVLSDIWKLDLNIL